jgi:3-hydroxyacyl-CoA dehydrogenase/enoyl-CoA hydratase/3-hydroxybutyryl-CoA epimerase/3-hydroxyacyl-CoA dehydrogenase/enoyl-CoA hydratase/3-hydroxybutyryl-CoA epimerase/enoyl-CoA isomerase
VVVISFFVPDHAQNVLTAEALTELSRALASVDAGPPPAAVVLRSTREGSFFAGADIARLERLHGMPPEEIERLCAAGRAVFSRLSSQPWPSVAIIDGICLGGGLELALACDLRVATDSPQTALGCPEVKLGLLPAWGGTVRLARLIGPAAAVELAAAGENVDGPTAARLGLVDACVPADQADISAGRLAEIAAAQQNHIERRRRMAGPVTLVAEERDFLESMSAAVILGRSGGHYPAPLAILETILACCDTTADEAGTIEATAFARLAKSDVSRQLIRVFRLGERNRRDKGLDDGSPSDGSPHADRVASSDQAPRNRPAIIGAGIMGAGIAASHLRAGFAVTLVDVQADTLAASVATILDEAAWDRGTKRTDPARAVALSGKLHTATRMAAIAECDLVIESVLERADIKRQVLVEIEQTVGPTTVIATNTSTNPIAKLAEPLQDPTRFCGIHFFNPVRRMTLVEVIRGPATSDATVATAVAHVKRLGKCPIVVRDSPGFLVNRVLMPYLHESVEMLREGIEAKRIDRVARGFGMPMGPLELYDMIGLDTAFYAGLVLSAAYGDRIEASPLIPALVKSGRLGRKTGAGFYHYSTGGQYPKDGQRARIDRPDEGVMKLVRPYALPARETTDATICDRLLLPMLLEALRVLDEGIVRDGRDIDLAVIHALGFPAFRGGLLAWGNSLGAAEVVRRLAPLTDLGIRMHPTQRLLAMAAAGESFTV